MIYALIVAAGKGIRIGGEIPKQFLNCKDRPVLSYTIEAFEKNKNIDGIIVVTSADYINEVRAYAEKYRFNKIKDIVEGGETRQLSVFRGLSAIIRFANTNNAYVLIHDGARPLVSEEIINNNCEALKNHDCVCTVIKDTDTTYFSNDGHKIDSVMDRNSLYFAQTPQSFKLSTIYKLHRDAFTSKQYDSSDDIQLAGKACLDIFLVEGNKKNIKITNPEDLAIFEALLGHK